MPMVLAYKNSFDRKWYRGWITSDKFRLLRTITSFESCHLKHITPALEHIDVDWLFFSFPVITGRFFRFTWTVPTQANGRVSIIRTDVKNRSIIIATLGSRMVEQSVFTTWKVQRKCSKKVSRAITSYRLFIDNWKVRWFTKNSNS